MSRTLSMLVCLVTVIGGVANGTIRAAHADVLVIASKTSGIRAGSVLRDDTVLDVPAGQSLTLLLSDNRTRTITGPFNQRIDAFSKGAPSDPSLWSQVSANLRDASDGRAPKKKAKKDSGPAVAMRTAPAREPVATARAPAPPEAAASRQMAFSWRHIPIDGQGDYCIQKGDGLTLVRPAATAAQPATVVDMRAGARANVLFAAGSTTLPWPAAIPARTGPYALQLPDSAPRQIRLRIIDPLPAADETLRLLHSQRCQAQIEAWVRGVATASR